MGSLCMNSLRSAFERAPYAVFWCAVFGATCVTALTLQLIVLPFFLPQLHAGDGLLVGGDWVSFHAIASALADEIRRHGWQVWTLRPAGQTAAGIAAAIYALTVSKPLVLIPLYAALHATAGVAAMRIIRYLTNNDITALCSALPFVLYPSAMVCYAQIHKDGFYFAGAFLCLYGWILLARLQTWRGGSGAHDRWGGGQMLTGLTWLGIGLALMGLVRTYAFQVMQAMGLILAVGLSVLFIVRATKGQLSPKSCVVAIAVLFLVPLLLRFAPVDSKLSAQVPESFPPAKIINNTAIKDNWRSSGWLPRTLENNFLWIAQQRDGYVHREVYVEQKAGSMLDGDVRLLSVGDVVAYLPRATQVGFLAPFPASWFEPGNSPGGSLMRRLAGMEMIGVYCAFLFLPYAMWRWRRRVEMWMAVVFGSVQVLIYAVSTPNIGSLYRQRYGFLMLLVGIGLAGGLTALKSRCVRGAKK